jgi:hypothetical protein
MGSRVGILAIQGDVEAHGRSVERLGCEVVPVLRARELRGLDALILPGGESTTIAKGLDRLALYEPIREAARGGLPILGTCAGAILLSRQVEVDRHPVESLGLLDVTPSPPRSIQAPRRASKGCVASSSGLPGFETWGKASRCSPASTARPSWSASGRCSPPPSTPSSPTTSASTPCSWAAIPTGLRSDAGSNFVRLRLTARAAAAGVPCGQGGFAGR